MGASGMATEVYPTWTGASDPTLRFGARLVVPQGLATGQLAACSHRVDPVSKRPPGFGMVVDSSCGSV